MTTFIYLDAPAGSGKTESLLHYTLNEVQGLPNALYVAPTNDLLDSVLVRYTAIAKDRPVHYFEKITAETKHSRKPVIQQLHETLNDPIDPEYVCFATHEAAQRLNRTGKLSDWILIVDEIPPAVRTKQLTIGQTHQLLTDHLDLETPDAEYSLLKCKDKAAMQQIASNRDKDELFAVLREAAQILTSPSFDVFVKSATYKELLAKKASSLHLFSCLKPAFASAFDKVVIAGANFKDSLLYQIWTRRGVVLKKDAKLSALLRFGTHENGARLTIHCTKLSTWSNAVKKKIVQDQSFLEHLLGKLKGRFGTRALLYSANIDDEEALFSDTAWKRLPAIAHGLNEFQGYHGVICLGAFKRSPPEYRFLQSLGLSSDEVTRATHCETIYQAVARCSLRDPEASEPVDVFVPDIETAEYLQSKWPGSSISIHDWIPEHLANPRRTGRRKLHSSATDRKSHSKQKRQIDKAIEATSTLLESPFPLVNILESIFDCHGLKSDESTYSIGRNVANLSEQPEDLGYLAYAMQFRSRYRNKAYKIIGLPIEDFVDYLKQCHYRDVASKESNELLSPALYAFTEDAKKKRTKSNIAFCSGIWLDFDEGNITPENVADALCGLRIVAKNSYNSKPGHLRWHAYIPTSTVMSRSAYDLIAQDIAGILKDKLGTKCLDKSKLNCANLFYLPCQAGAGPEASFFADFKENRQPIDVLGRLQDILERHQASKTAQEEQPEDDVVLPVQVERVGTAQEAWDRWVRFGTLRGRGNEEFYLLNLNLVHAEVDDDTRRDLLNNAADMASSPEDRRKDIPRLMEITLQLPVSEANHWPQANTSGLD